MGFLDELKDKAGKLGEKAKHGFDSAKDKAADLVDDVKDRLDGDDHPDRAHDDNPMGQSDTKIEDPDAAADVVNDTPATASESVVDTDDRGIDPVAAEAAVEAESDASSTVGDEAGLAEDFAADAPSSDFGNDADGVDLSADAESEAVDLSADAESEAVDLSADAESEAVDLGIDAPYGENSDSGMSTDGLQETSESAIDAGQADAGTLDGDPDSASSWS